MSRLNASRSLHTPASNAETVGHHNCRTPFIRALLLVCWRTVGKAHSHAAEPEGRNFQVAVSKCTFLHLSRLLSLSKGRNFLPPRSGLVLFVADLFHPVGGLAVELFLNGDVRHGRGCRGA